MLPSIPAGRFVPPCPGVTRREHPAIPISTQRRLRLRGTLSIIAAATRTTAASSSIVHETRRRKFAKPYKKAIGRRLATLCGASLWPRRHAPRPPRYVWLYGGYQREQWLQSAVQRSSAKAAHHCSKAAAHPKYGRAQQQYEVVPQNISEKKGYCVLYYFQVFFVFVGELPEKKACRCGEFSTTVNSPFFNQSNRVKV